MTEDVWGLKTRILHHGAETDPHTGAAAVPVYQVSTFAQKDPVNLGKYEYARGENPTREALEHAIARLEGGDVGVAFASGMAAISSVLLLFRPGDHLLVAEDVYGGTYRAVTTIFRQWGLESTFVDTSDPGNIAAAIRPETRAIFVETPSNPILKITDLAAVSAIAREKKLISIVDNTFMTPYLQRPIEHGFDIVVHSATKFLGGHSDLIAGLVVTRDAEVGGRLKFIQRAFGAILGPQDAFLLSRGIKTLGARMEAQQANAEKIARWLTGGPGIRKVYYPTLTGHQGREVHLRQSAGGGAVVSFELQDGPTAHRFMRSVRLPLLAVSLGGVESILSYPATMSHGSMPREERRTRGITDGLVRLSVGLEDPEDMIRDLANALTS
ncbi:PLP-dependent aspartate aminotransferase family protein [Candidatus Deferrimicrobium sp.]|uniref:trans-sulfuration enzyme family protein n=1 Tax=Candidatus Deferrimicrobium sp. TaxID=3060586 RepID=UPI002ED3D2C2